MENIFNPFEAFRNISLNQFLLNKFVSLSRPIKRLVMILADILALVSALLIAFFLHVGQWYWPQGGEAWLLVAAPIIAIPLFSRFGLYRAIIRYIGFKAIWVIVQAVSLYSLIIGMGVLITSIGVPRSVILIN